MAKKNVNIEESANVVANEVVAKPTKHMTDDELAALHAELLNNLNHKVSVVPFGEWEWVDGYIHNVNIETRARKIFYDIKTVDGRTVRKVYNAKGLRILDEVVEERVTKRRTAAGPREEWSAEKWDEVIRTYIPAIGRWMQVSPDVYGRIVSLVPDKRVNMLLLRIEVVDENGDKKIMHKSFNALNWDELSSDENSEADATAWLERYEKRLTAEPRAKVSKRERLTEQLEKAMRRVEDLQNQLAELDAQESEEML